MAADAQQAGTAMQLAGEHVQPWAGQRLWAVAEEFYTGLAKALPAAARHQGEMAVVGLWVQQVVHEHSRLQAIGLTVPRELDPTLKKALVRLYEMQAGLDPDSPALKAIRLTWDGIIAHYKALEYDDVAEAAIAVKGEKPVDVADEYAAFQSIVLQHERAAKEFARLLKQHVAGDQVPLTPGFKTVLAAWTKFITDRPTSRLAPQAVERIFGVGRVYEQQGAFAVAAGIYGDLAKFAAGVKVLAQSTPGSASVAQRAAYTQATALDALARKVLAKAAADRKPDEPPPAKLSDEFTAAIAAYKAFIEANPESPLVGESINKVMAVAIEYARIDAWDVADSVFADLLKSKLKIRRPERLEFARGVCQLGRAMPDHAREVLSLLISTGLRGSSEPTDPAMLAGMMGAGGFGMGDGAGTAPVEASQVAATSRPASRSRAAVRGREPELRRGQRRARRRRRRSLCPRLPVCRRSRCGGGTLTLSADEKADAMRDSQLLAAIRKQESSRAVQVAQLREKLTFNQPMAQQEQGQQADTAAGARRARPLRGRTGPPGKGPRRGLRHLPGRPQELRRNADRRAGPGGNPGDGRPLAGPERVAAVGGVGLAVPGRQPDRPAAAAASPGDRPRPAGLGRQAARQEAHAAGDARRGVEAVRRPRGPSWPRSSPTSRRSRATSSRRSGTSPTAS